jgi:hypothetical protein
MLVRTTLVAVDAAGAPELFKEYSEFRDYLRRIMEYKGLLHRLVHLCLRRSRLWLCMASIAESIETSHLHRLVPMEAEVAAVVELGMDLANPLVDHLDHLDRPDHLEDLDHQEAPADLEEKAVEKVLEKDSEQSFSVHATSSPPTPTGNPTNDGGSNWAIGYGKCGAQEFATVCWETNC